MDLRPLIAPWLLVLAVIGTTGAQAQTAAPAASNQPDARKPRIAPMSQWPAACSLITLEDLEQVFTGKTVRPYNKLYEVAGFVPMATVTASRTQPQKSCHFWVAWEEVVNGYPGSTLASVGLTIEHLVESPEVAHKYYEYSRLDGRANVEIPGLGDEASISGSNQLYLRKGLLTVSLNAPDGASGGEGKQWATELARRVAARMP